MSSQGLSRIPLGKGGCVGPGTVYSRQREHTVPSRLAKPIWPWKVRGWEMGLERSGRIRSYFRSPKGLACGINEHLTKLSAGVSPVNSSPAKNRYNLRSDSAKLLREKPFLATLDAFELWCWRRLLRVPWTARRSNQSILKEINPEYSSEGLMLKLKLNTLAIWWEELTHWKGPRTWEGLKAGGEAGIRGWDGWMTSSTQWTWVCASSGRW